MEHLLNQPISLFAAAWGMASATLYCIDELLKLMDKNEIFPDRVKTTWMVAYIVLSIGYFAYIKL